MRKLTHKIVILAALAAAVIGFSAGSAWAAEEAGLATPEGLVVSPVFPDEIIPFSFHKTTTTYLGQQIEAAQFDNGSVLLLYVTDGNGGGDNYKIYDETTGELNDFRMVSGPNDKFIMVLTPPEDVIVPPGFEKAVLDWNGQTLSAYVNTSAQPLEGSDVMPSEFFLLYAQSNEGKNAWYLYDQVENTYQRYAGFGATAAEEDILNIEAAKEGDNTALIRLIIGAVLVLIIIILIIVVCILGHKLREYNEYEYIDEEDYNAANQRNEHIYNVMSEGIVDDSAPLPNNIPSSVSSEEDVADTRDDKDSYYPQPPAAKSSRRAILETGDIADLEDILNDPDGTSELPLPAQIELAARAQSDAKERAAAKSQQVVNDTEGSGNNEETTFENMQVTVDRFQAGMPAMVDTKAIAEETQNVAAPPVEQYAEDLSEGRQYGDEGYYPEEPLDPEDDDDWDYISKDERKERKAIYKEQMREYKEALKDAKYLEKERKKAEKRKNKGYDSPEAMDWGSFKTSMTEGEADDRRPRGNNSAALPSYVRSDMSVATGEAVATAASVEGSAATVQSEIKTETAEPLQAVSEEPARELTEEERASAAADAVIRAARGTGDTGKTPTDEEIKSEQGYNAYRQSARNTYEEYRKEDDEVALRQQSPVQNKVDPQFTQDLDEDFEFEFLNIRHPS